MTNTNKYARVLQIAIVVFMTLAASNSIWTLKANAAPASKRDKPYCGGLLCFSGNDCGSNCFCSSSDGICYSTGANQ
jgi:hypothetical protein